MRQKSWSGQDGLVLILFAGLVILFYWRILTPNLADRQSFPPGDFAHQFWAFTTFEVRELSAGRLPLWNPYTFAGAPFWADVQAAVFYPPSLLTLLLSAPWGFSLFALEIEAIVHIWLAGVFMYLFIRQLTHSRAAALIAALTFTFSGYLTGYPGQQLAVLETGVWLPLILFFLHRWRRREGAEEQRRISHPPNPSTSLRTGLPISQPPTLPTSHPPTLSLLLAGLAWGMALLAGHPQSAFIVAWVSLAYFFFLWFFTPPPAAGRRPRRTTNDERPTTNDHQAQRTTPKTGSLLNVLRFTFYVLRSTYPAPRVPPHSSLFTLHSSFFIPLLLFLLTGFGLAAIQFIPAVEYTLLSVRAEGAYDKMSGGFPVVDLIQLLLPGQVSFYSPLYISLAGLILAGWVIFVAANRPIFFWALLAGLTLLIALGGNSFLYSPLYLFVPGFSIFRGQERWAFATAFSLCVLVGYGFQAWQVAGRKLQVAGEQPFQDASSGRLEDSPPLPCSPAPLLLSLTTYLLLFALLLTFLFFFGLNDTGWTPDSPFYKLLGGATWLSVLLALFWLLLKASITWPWSPAVIAGLTAALIGLDLFTANWQTNLYPQLPEWHTQMPAAVAAIKQDAAQTPADPYRVYNEFRLYDNYGVPFELEDLWGASPLRPARYDRFLAPPLPLERAWALLNVKYVITWREELFVPSTIIYQEPAGDGATYVHRLDEVGPRAWLVYQAELAGEAAILQKIADPAFDVRRKALLEPDAEAYVQNLSPSTRIEDAPLSHSSAQNPSVRLITRQASHLVYQVNTPTPALLILSEPYYPGWQATIDHQSVPLLRANYILRAIPVPAGEHEVKLTFRPLSFTVGAVISGLTLVLLLIAIIFAYQRRTHDKNKLIAQNSEN